MDFLSYLFCSFHLENYSILQRLRNERMVSNMAKHNLVLLNGQVLRKPKLIPNKNTGEIETAMCPIWVIRGVRDFGNNIDHVKHDAPIIMTRNPELIKIMETWEVGDMVEVKGSLTTKDVIKGFVCKHCGQKQKKKGSLVYINPIFLEVHEKRLTPEQGLQKLKERCEISNQVTLIGAVCREPQLYTTEKGLAITTYQMAVRRKYRIATDSTETKTDFPWVKSYGNIAKNDAASIKKGTYIFIDGMLQTREFDRSYICQNPECGKENHFTDFAMEIVPFATEYLRDYYTQEEILAREKEQNALAVKSVFNEDAIDENRPLDAPEYEVEKEDDDAKKKVSTSEDSASPNQINSAIASEIFN